MGYIRAARTLRHFKKPEYYESLGAQESHHATTPAKVSLIGAPASGKNALGRSLSVSMRLPLINAQDELNRVQDRAEFQALFKKYSNSKLNQQLVEQAKSGKDVDAALIELRLLRSAYKAENGFLLEDFPKTLGQAQRLLEAIPDLNLVVYFDLPNEILLERAIHGLACDGCGRKYNGANFAVNGREIEADLPVQAGICDTCGGNVKPVPEAVKKSHQAAVDKYRKDIEPVLKFFDSQGILNVFDPVYGTDDTERLRRRILGNMNVLNE